MEIIIGILFVIAVGVIVYKMMTKKETVGQAIDESIKEATPVVEKAVEKAVEAATPVVEKAVAEAEAKVVEVIAKVKKTKKKKGE